MSNLNDASLNMLSLLDAKIEDLADMPTWSTFPAGAYKVKPSVKKEQKKNAKTNVMEDIITIGAKLIEVKETADPAAVKPEVGAETSSRFTWQNEYGQGGLKNLLMPIATFLKTAGQPVPGVMGLMDILHSADSVIIVMGQRVVKGQNGAKDQVYQTFEDLMVD
jgi:hypothetical protein